MGKKVLVVDASLTVRKQVGLILGQAGISILEAESVESCLMALKENAVDAILSGLDLKGSQPQHICGEIERFFNPKIPLILMFANDRDVHFCDWTARLGIKGCVPKPLSENSLRSVVARVLKS